MSKIRIGEFTVDIEKRQIFDLNGELSVEPKVIDVLCYLAINAERYVSLQELHAEVWAGRIVTDTAVRRTVSKLRSLLGDTDTENPQFIRSQMKRGYQLIAETAIIDAAPPKSLDTEALRQAKPDQDAAFSKTRYLYYIAIAILVLVVMAVGIKLYGKNQAVSQIIFHTLLDIPGEKMSLVVSGDGRYQAFVGRLNNSGRWHVYLNDSLTGQLNRVDVPGELIHSVSFIKDSQLLAIVSYSGGIAHIYLKKILELDTAAVKVNINDFSLLDQILSLDNERILFNGASSQDSAVLYYILNLNDLNFARFSFSSNNYIVDSGARLSPDHSKLALLRRNTLSKENFLQIYNITTRELINEWPLVADMEPESLEWLNEGALIIAARGNIITIDTNSGKNSEDTFLGLVSALSRDNQGNLYALLNDQPRKQVYEMTLPFGEGFSRRIRVAENVEQFYYNQEIGKYWLLEKQDSKYHLSVYNPDSVEKKPVLSSSEPFRILDEVIGHPLLLLRHNWQFQVLNTESGHLTPVSVRTQSVEYAAFSQDAEKVYFSENVNGQWLINEFTLSNSNLLTVARGYRVLVPYLGDFLAVTESGEVVLLNAEFLILQHLPFSLNPELPYRIYVRNKSIIALNQYETGDWVLHQYQLQSNLYHSETIASSQISLNMSVSEDGSKLLFINNKIGETKLVSLGYNFGYN